MSKMKIEREELETFWVSLLCSEIAGVLVIAYAFLTPLPIWSKLLILGGITYVATSRETAGIQLHLIQELRGLRQSIWLDNLTLRFGLDEMLERMQAGKHLQIDWDDASQGRC